MKTLILIMVLMTASLSHAAEGGKWVQTEYGEQKVLFDFYFDEPEKISSALYWIRSLMNPLMDAPYEQPPELMDIIVLVHGTEIVTLAKNNNKKYYEPVERMRYYSDLGVKFKVCGLAAQDYDYTHADFYDFVEVIPSAITELAHWQLQGYAVITPQVLEKKHAIEEIR